MYSARKRRAKDNTKEEKKKTSLSFAMEDRTRNIFGREWSSQAQIIPELKVIFALCIKK